MQQFIASHARARKELVLDIDASHVPLHGEQERGHFHAYYDNYCYLPLYVFAGQDLLGCVLRPSDRDPASVVSALVKRLLVPLRRAWSKTKIIVRADAGFCRTRVPERWGAYYIIGLQKNSRLNEQVSLAEMALAERYAAKQTKQRMFGEFQYAAKTWDKPRRVIARFKHGEHGANPRFIVTDLTGSAQALYERRYCARGEAENRIKEAQLDLFGRRASCHRFCANQLRLLLAALALPAPARQRYAPSCGRAQHAPCARAAGLGAADEACFHHRRTRAQPVEIHSVPGLCVDTKTARIPSRGRSHCMRRR